MIIDIYDNLTKLIEESEYYYVFDLAYDLIDSKVVMSLCKDPDNIEVELKVTFTRVEEFTNKSFRDSSGACIAEVQNYEFKQSDERVIVIINTGDSNLEFTTAGTPLVDSVTSHCIKK